MSFSLNEVFDQAKQDGFSVNVDAFSFEGRLLYGIKIVRDLKEKGVTILNTQQGGDHYREVTPNDYELFQLYGWRHGVYVLSLSNCCLKLDKILEAIEREESRDECREKVLAGARTQLSNAKARHALMSKKFNQFKSNSYDTSKE
tara:strand:+ start:347 stop:781 length:435 start_codon:yes stop_codon:yes gene_type:complete